MQPQSAPQPVNTPNQYDFLLNQTQTPKQSKLAKLPGMRGQFARRIAIIAGGGLLLVIVFIIVASLFFGGSSTTDNLVKLSQQQNELIRVASQATNHATEQTTKNLAINTQFVLATDQEQLVAYTKKHGRKITTKELAAARSTATDQKLTTAQAASNFDAVFVQIIQSELTDYRSLLQQTFTASKVAATKKLLNTDFANAANLLTQANEAASALSSNP